jgi:glycosyltransferase involved in cell wall biosynthesis
MDGESCLYGREPELIALIPTRKKKFVELHHLYGLRRFGKTLLKQFGGIITLTQALKDDVTSRYAYPIERIQVVPSGVNLKEFERPESKVSARTRLGLPLDAKIALYIGSLEAWKGVGTFLDVSHELKDSGILSVVMGGTDAHIKSLQSQYGEVIFLGHHPQSELSHNQQAADVLVVPNTAKEEISARHTSPLKVFAHMASGVPIVASATEAIGEVLNDTNAVLVPPDEPEALYKGIQTIIGNNEHARAVARQAKIDVLHYDWEYRTETIISFINGRNF